MTVSSSLGVIEQAMSWAGALLGGQLSVVISIIAVAGIGLAMLGGQLSVRRSGQLAIGIFLIFGAPFLANGLLTTVRPEGDSISRDESPAYSAPPQPPAKQLQSEDDPYAGASLRGR